MRMITGFLAPNAGTMKVCGFDVAQEPNDAKRMIGYLPEGAPAYGEMTPHSFLKFICNVRGVKGEEADQALAMAVERAQLSEVLEQPINTLSKGFKRRVGLAQAILHDPPVLIMDEPTDGLDPNQKHAVRGLIKAMAKDKTIIISTHILEEVEAVCTRALIIDRGKIVADGSPRELASRSRYLNAVTIDIAGHPDVDEAAEAFSKMEGVGRIEEIQGPNEVKRFTLFPTQPEHILIEDVSRLASQANWNVRTLFAEPGRLDDVFRALTTPDTDTGEAA
jgi:ABC-2 type transport system ATP-binding protein